MRYSNFRLFVKVPVYICVLKTLIFGLLSYVLKCISLSMNRGCYVESIILCSMRLLREDI